MAFSALTRELSFALRDRSLLAWLLVTFLLAGFAVASGSREVAQQTALIEQLARADAEDRRLNFEKQSDWGGAAYYTFHLTYDPPSDFAFAALGQRDNLPWKHRIRMLALEGQVYESDVSNPELSLIGRFDFAFFAAFVVPLILIAGLADLRASERDAGRLELIEVTATSPMALWRTRGWLRLLLLCTCSLVPLWIGGLWNGAGVTPVLMASLLVLLHAAFWGELTMRVGAWPRPSVVLLIVLVGVWLLLGLVLPSAASVAIDRMVTLPSLSEIAMTQRETVNDAWDLPKEATMTRFVARHPAWTDHTEVSRPFEWKWYYAFQQVGDQSVEADSKALRDGRRKRDRYASRAALLSPPTLVERYLQKLARTDVPSLLDYEEQVREFHGQLRAFYYPRLFRDTEFEGAVIADLPRFSPADRDLPGSD